MTDAKKLRAKINALNEALNCLADFTMRLAEIGLTPSERLEWDSVRQCIHEAQDL